MKTACVIGLVVVLAFPGSSAAGPCVDPADIEGFASFEVDVASSLFAVHTRSGSDPLGGRGDALLLLLEDAVADYAQRGWRSPAGIDTSPMLVFVEALPGGVGGYTRVASCGDTEGEVDYMVVSEAWLDDDERLAPLVAHELFHTVQRQYLPEAFGPDATNTGNQWFIEASAVYEESLVFPQFTRTAEERSVVWSLEPWWALKTTDGLTEYARFIYPLALEAMTAGPQWHLEVWETAVDEPTWDVVAAIDEVTDRGFDAGVRDYLVLASEMDLPRLDGLVGPRDVPSDGSLSGLTDFVDAEELPGDGDVPPGDPEGPQSWGANYVWFDGQRMEPETALRLEVALDPETPDGALVTWAVEVVAASGGEVVNRLSVVPASADPRAVVVVHGIAESIDGVWLIVSPGPDFVGETPGWSWSARVHPGESELRLEELAPGCGCASLGSRPSGAAPPILALLLLAVVWRRRVI
ncbi:MAG: hypothetical protein KDA24_19920 [Deltaproteobacteria bacterium]|nr:hypothetical protein [Deltaproteobacteria bacterium]